jgi:glutathione S-transferase
MKLYFSPGTCSLSPHIVLREAGFKFTTEKVDLKAHATSSGTALATVHEKNYVPILELDNGERLTEGPVIVQYLADQKPEAELIPRAGTMERYRVLEWLNYTTSELHKTFYPLFHPELPVDDWREASRAKVARTFGWVNAQLSERKYLVDERFTVADAYLFTVANWANAVSIDLAQWPALARYQARIAARPLVQETLQAEGLKVRHAA